MFIERHGLGSGEQRAKARELRKRLEREPLELVRVAWADPHGASRAKALSLPLFLDALETGYNINVATTTLDAAGGRVFKSFTRGGGMGLDEMTGSPNLTVVPDPSTFRTLPWAPGVGWVLCDEYFRDGKPFHFSPRHLLRRQVARLGQKKMQLMVGLEMEWYLARLAETQLSEEHVGIPGVRGRAIRTAPIEPGYSYHSETNMDLMQPVLGELARTYAALGLRPSRRHGARPGRQGRSCDAPGEPRRRAGGESVSLHCVADRRRARRHRAQARARAARR